VSELCVSLRIAISVSLSMISFFDMVTVKHTRYLPLVMVSLQVC
jgi:hypothetical protein